MAHCWDRGPGYLRVLVAAGFALAQLDAGALDLGEAQVRSALGENLDLRIPMTLGKGESIEPSCFTLAREPAASVPRISGARVSLERSAAATYLRIRTDGVVTEPALVLGVVAACRGLAAEFRRDYSLLVDPRISAPAPSPVARDTGVAAPPAAVSSFFPSIATLIARIGDTLESIANAIFPSNRTAQKAYIQALREANPPLATLPERDPIPVDTPVALPDLRAFSAARPGGEARAAAAPSAASEAPRAAGVPAPEAKPAPAPRQRTPLPKAEPQAAPAVTPPPRAASAPAATTREKPATAKRPEAARSPSGAPGFMLKLSSSEMDLSPSRSVNDRMRAQLRDRQLVLDADDQVAAVLSLRDSVRQLESRVAELQLKLAGMPNTFPAPKGAAAPVPAAATPPPQASAAPPPVVASAPVAVEKAPAASVPAPTEKAPVAIAPVEKAPAPIPAAPVEKAPVAASPAPDTAPATVAAKTEPSPPPAATPPTASAAPKPAQSAAAFDWAYYGLWALAFLLVIAAILLAMRLAKRRSEETNEDEDEEVPQHAAQATTPDDEIVVALEPAEGDAPFAGELERAPAAHQRMLDADVDIATRLPDNNADDLRRRYIEERFPEIGKGAIVLDQPDSVVKGARLFYEDRAIARAVELLQFAIERHPGEVKSWLALFEIFRLEGLTGEFAELARRFREEHGKSDYWRKVQYFGREIDPGNELYAEKPLNTFETIGPTQARRLAEKSFDPITENWLGAPMDFQNEVLANELRKALMAGAGIAESDLVPNPMPALRNVEMFTVA